MMIQLYKLLPTMIACTSIAFVLTSTAAVSESTQLPTDDKQKIEKQEKLESSIQKDTKNNADDSSNKHDPYEHDRNLAAPSLIDPLGIYIDTGKETRP